MGPAGPAEAKYGRRFGSAQGAQGHAMPWHPHPLPLPGGHEVEVTLFKATPTPGFIHCPPRGAGSFAPVPLLPRPGTGARAGEMAVGARGWQGLFTPGRPGGRSP